MTSKRYNRVYADGCYDICHFGHYNFVRQASELGAEVIAGVHNDEVITSYKGPPVYNLSERLFMIGACKWVTKAIPDAPFNITVKFLDQINCDCSVHGDDIVVNNDGESCYASVIKAGRFETVQRAKSISTTNLIGRILRLPDLKLPDGFDKPLLKNFRSEKVTTKYTFKNIYLNFLIINGRIRTIELYSALENSISCTPATYRS